MAAEATGERAAPELFATHTVMQLLAQSDYEREAHGRLNEPMAYDAATDSYRPTGWKAAYARVARHLQALPSPDGAAFRTSGRASNEASFLCQLFPVLLRRSSEAGGRAPLSAPAVRAGSSAPRGR